MEDGSITKIVLESIGAGCGAFLGAVVFFWYKEWVANKRKRQVLINAYLPSEANNFGEGKLIHRSGTFIKDIAQLKHYGLVDSVLSYEFRATTVPNVGEDRCVFFGPYKTDMNKPGRYKVVFEFGSKGFSKNADYKLQEAVLLTLDIYKGDQIHSIAHVRYKDFLNENYKAEMVVYSNGVGVWEYRAWIAESLTKNPNVLIGAANLSVFFKRVSVVYIPEIEIPW